MRFFFTLKNHYFTPGKYFKKSSHPCFQLNQPPSWTEGDQESALQIFQHVSSLCFTFPFFFNLETNVFSPQSWKLSKKTGPHTSTALLRAVQITFSLFLPRRLLLTGHTHAHTPLHTHSLPHTHKMAEEVSRFQHRLSFHALRGKRGTSS